MFIRNSKRFYRYFLHRQDSLFSISSIFNTKNRAEDVSDDGVIDFCVVISAYNKKKRLTLMLSETILFLVQQCLQFVNQIQNGWRGFVQRRGRVKLRVMILCLPFQIIVEVTPSYPMTSSSLIIRFVIELLMSSPCSSNEQLTIAFGCCEWSVNVGNVPLYNMA